MLKRDIEIGQDQALRHQGDQIANMRVGVDIMQPHPNAQLTQLLRQIGDMRADLPLGRGFDIDTIGAGVLRDD